MTAVGAPPFLTSALLERAGLPHLFTTRHFPGVASTTDGGEPFTAEARPLLAERGLAAAPAYARQVHGSQVLVAEREGRLGEADALLTERARLPLAIFTADCLPLVIYDPAGRRLAAVHAGWRGTCARVGQAAMDAMRREFGSDPANLIAAIGPSVGPEEYEVGESLIEAFLAAGHANADVDRWFFRSPTKPHLDLWSANRDQLIAAGLLPA